MSTTKVAVEQPPIVTEALADGRVTLHCGDCRDAIRLIPDNSIDAIVTDPPYALVSIQKRFGKPGSKPAKDVYGRGAAGFMGKTWDTGEVAFSDEFWAECLRVLKPGGHVVAFSGTRTYHRMAVAIEDAGFEPRDMLLWHYGSGFPKSHDVSKAIDKAAGAERTKVRDYNPRNPKATGGGKDGAEGATRPWIEAAIARGYHEKDGDEPATPQAAEWQGWGTALKPATEPIMLARKPLDGTVASNVLEHGTGALNIDGARIKAADSQLAEKYASVQNAGSRQNSIFGADIRDRAGATPHELGRWPANVILEGSDEVTDAFPDGASRFFYSAKADAEDRLGSKHPTVKPVDLMQWLCRLITPPGGTILDPFAGSGSTGEAALREGFSAVLCERETEYQADIKERIRLALSGPLERRARIASRRPQAGMGGLFGDNDNAPPRERSLQQRNRSTNRNALEAE
ncbi:DNA-methyltransferase [Devosia elaeis]|uniref:Methyltransferase n=1 Tax=Devosia elaeis TaxID=1770058 RepID=A0A178HY23_9HYPH|nr:site-specific DNA-methyltransferase [Devosia elaeis]OAM77721.1 hypothetical protein A3840_08830 [Devosia elaeis]